VGGEITLAQLDVDGGHAGGGSGLHQPFGQPPADAAPLMLRIHGEQHQMRSLVTQRHDGKAGRSGVRAGDQRHRLRIVDEAGDAFRPVVPAEPGFDQVARQLGQRRRIRAAREAQGDAIDTRAMKGEDDYARVIPSPARRADPKNWVLQPVLMRSAPLGSETGTGDG